MMVDLVFTEKLEDEDKKEKKRTMEMHDSWLGKDPSTVLDGDFALAASEGCVRVCVFGL